MRPAIASGVARAMTRGASSNGSKSVRVISGLSTLSTASPLTDPRRRRHMERRQFIKVVVGGSVALFAPARAWPAILTNGRNVALECLGSAPGVRILDGRTQNGTVALVDKICIKTRT